MGQLSPASEYKKAWRAANPDRVKAIQRRHYEKTRAPGTPGREKFLSEMREYHFQRKFGISAADKDARVEAQGNKCAMCGNEFTGPSNAHMDHDHTTGALRGVLCSSCNRRLGWYELHAEQVGAYLKKWGRK